VDADGLPHLRGVHPWQYRDYAALRGDPSDNLHGVRRFRTAAARLQASFGTAEAAWAAADDGPAVRDVVGDLAAEQLSAPADGAEQTSTIAGKPACSPTSRSCPARSESATPTHCRLHHL
jgi:5'-3' exonuclease